MAQGSDIMHSIQEVPMLCKRLFKLEVDFYEVLELLPIVLKKTGGFATKPFLFKGTIKNFELELPCNVYGIKYVCSSKPISWYSQFYGYPHKEPLLNYRVDQSGNAGLYNQDATHINEINSEPTDSLYVVNKNVFSSPLGAMIPFENKENECLSFNHKEGEVDVLYVGTVLDADRYPKIPEKSLEAVAYYMQYIDMRMKFNRKIATGDQMKLAKDEMTQAIAQAKTPSFLSQNEEDELLNVLTTHNRKRYNIQHRS